MRPQCLSPSRTAPSPVGRLWAGSEVRLRMRLLWAWPSSRRAPRSRGFKRGQGSCLGSVPISPLLISLEAQVLHKVLGLFPCPEAQLPGEGV